MKLLALRYSLPSGGHARLEVFDITGRLVVTLVDEVMQTGQHRTTWAGTDAAGR